MADGVVIYPKPDKDLSTKRRWKVIYRLPTREVFTKYYRTRWGARLDAWYLKGEVGVISAVLYDQQPVEDEREYIL